MGKDCAVSAGDEGCDSDALCALLVESDIFPCLGIRRDRVENFFAKVKRQRRISTRYGKLTSVHLSLD